MKALWIDWPTKGILEVSWIPIYQLHCKRNCCDEVSCTDQSTLLQKQLLWWGFMDTDQSTLLQKQLLWSSQVISSSSSSRDHKRFLWK
jgi:hypothetical protein